MKWFQVRKLIDQWLKTRFRTKIISIGALLAVLMMGTTVFVAIYWLPKDKNDSWIPEGPYAVFGLNITTEEVYVNKTIRFTVQCFFISYGGYPIPEDDLFQITKVFVCLEDDLLEFNDSIGDIQDVESTSVLFGDFCLSPYEEVRLEFQSRFPLQAEAQLYIGVFAMTCWEPPSINRWDRYTTILAA
ncbi:MAG: hypothetical protein ACFFBQ_19430 [Promethearchaeota archaeon]